MEIYRRQFLFGLTGIFAFPAIPSYFNIMPIKALPVTRVWKIARLDNIIMELNIFTVSPEATKQASDLLEETLGFPDITEFKNIQDIQKISFLPSEIQSPHITPWKPEFKLKDWVSPFPCHSYPQE